MTPAHALQGLIALVSREVIKFVHASLWLLVFAAGFRNVFGISIISPVA